MADLPKEFVRLLQGALIIEKPGKHEKIAPEASPKKVPEEGKEEPEQKKKNITAYDGDGVPIRISLDDYLVESRTKGDGVMMPELDAD